MTETFTRWDAADSLKTPEDVRLYVQACADEDPGDGSLICAALNDVARGQHGWTRPQGRHQPPRPLQGAVA